MKHIDVYGICNPLIDLLAHVPDSFLEDRGLEKNRMYLLPFEEQQTLFHALATDKVDVHFAPGGSAANTMIGIAQLGGSTAFSGKIAEDEHGRIYRSKLEEAGVGAYLGETSGITGSSLVLVTPDGSRTMNTHLGVSQEMCGADINESVMSVSKCMYLTGYLWDTDSQKEAVRTALAQAQEEDVRVAMSLSDPFCVNRHREDFAELLSKNVDILFCNQDEAFAMLHAKTSQEAIEMLEKMIDIVVMTMGGNGALIGSAGKTVYVDPFPVDVVDTTGAGDAFAAGFLYGLSREKTLLESGRIAAALASGVIANSGSRYEADAKAYVEKLIGHSL